MANKTLSSARVGDISVRNLGYAQVQARIDQMAATIYFLSARSQANDPWVKDAVALLRELQAVPPSPACNELIEEVMLLLAYHSTVDPRTIGAP